LKSFSFSGRTNLAWNRMSAEEKGEKRRGKKGDLVVGRGATVAGCFRCGRGEEKKGERGKKGKGEGGRGSAFYPLYALATLSPRLGSGSERKDGGKEGGKKKKKKGKEISSFRPWFWPGEERGKRGRRKVSSC